MRLTPRVFAILCALAVGPAAALVPGATGHRTFGAVDATATKHPECVDAARWHGRATIIAHHGSSSPSADACIDGRAMNVVVDASIAGIILPWDDAVEMDLKPNHRSYDQAVWIHGRTVKAARHRFEGITIGSIEIRDVEGYITNDPDIRTAVVGNAFLNRLGRHTFDKNGHFVLVAR